MKNQKVGKKIKRTALLSALLIEIGGVQAATITVDGNTCLLDDAIASANNDAAVGGCTAGAMDDVLELASSLDINLNSPLPDINSVITINANGSTIRRNSQTYGFPILTVSDGANLTLNDAIISGGVSSNTNSNNGGGIASSYNYIRAGRGGYASITVNVNRSQVINNTGGGIVVRYGDVSLTDSTVSDNTGVPNGPSYGYAAGVSVYGGNLTIVRSTIANNQNLGDSQGGGVFISNSYAISANLTVNNSTISHNNTESGGGGIHINYFPSYFYGSSVYANLSNATVVGNSTAIDGGAVLNRNGSMNIAQSLISGNTAGNLVNEIFNLGDFSSSGYSLVGLSGTASSIGVTLDASDAVVKATDLSAVVDPLLSDNGGLTLTHRPNPTGPVVDIVPEIECLNSVDQTGAIRPMEGDGDGDPECDVGSVEYNDIIFEDGFD